MESAAPAASSATPAPGNAQGNPGNAAAPDTRGTETKGKTQNAQTQQGGEAKSEDDDFEEIKLGSVKGKVPKHLAKVVKDLERGFYAKSTTAAQLAKEKQAMVERIKSDPRGLLKEHGIDPEEFAEMTMAEKIEALKMSDEERRFKEIEEENKRYKAKEEKEKQERETQAKQARHAQIQQSFDKEIAEAWKESGLPTNTFYIKQMAAVMMESMAIAKAGELERPLTAKEAARIVKDRFEASIPQMLSQMEPEAAIRLLGEETFSKWRDWDVNRVTRKAAPTPNADPESPAHKAASPKGPLSEAEWRKEMGIE